jgi:hypothetical protein
MVTLQGCVIDTAPRSSPDAASLAQALGVDCIALPRADAQRLSKTIDQALEA